MIKFICNKAFTTKFCKNCRHAFMHSQDKTCFTECSRNVEAMCKSYDAANLYIRLKSYFYRLFYL